MKQYHLVLVIVSLLVSNFGFASDNLRKEINLKRKWKFQTGDDSTYAEMNYDDSRWDKIWVPSYWQDQGYPHYEGMAWYRIDITITRELKEQKLFLKLGKIDDADEVYLNGKMIGKMGQLQQWDHTAYNINRVYPINSSHIKWGHRNVIAVRVWDLGGRGGIYQGDIGIYSRPVLKQLINLEGTWKAKKADHARFKEAKYDDSDWQNVELPSNWTSLGWIDMDAFAWFRKHVEFSSRLENKKLVFVSGKIDDADRVYFNGVLIGSMGDMPDSKGPHGNKAWNKDRVYYIPNHLIQWNIKNVISIRVYDGLGEGGIYSGPVGITTEQDYLNYLRQ